MNEFRLIAKAADFAARAHSHQKRKDERTPYFNHLAEVAWLLASAGSDANVVAAGYLHDAIEDAGITYEMLLAGFGQDIADLVRAVTDDKRLPQHVRKSLQIEHAPHAPARVANLKAADKISNLRSILDAPPPRWPEERRARYVAWAHAVVTRLHGVHPELLREYEAVREKLLARLPLAATADPVFVEG